MIDEGIERINKILLDNKFVDKNRIETVVKSDFVDILNNYFEFDASKINFNLNIKDGSYYLNFNLKVDRIKNVGIVPTRFA